MCIRDSGEIAAQIAVLTFMRAFGRLKDGRVKEPEVEETLTPVSYTHLDVYKRQRILCHI